MVARTEKVNIQKLFILLQALLYIGFLTLDLIGAMGSLSNYIKYTIILLCFYYALFCAGKGIIFMSSDRYPLDNNSIDPGQTSELVLLELLQIALLFTVISDLFLLILDYYLYGVISFIVTQQLYAVRLKLIYSKHNLPGRLLRQLVAQGLFTGAVLLMLPMVGTGIDFLLIVTVFYFISILTNVVQAFKTAVVRSGDKSNLLFAIGMLLFLLCDINVGLFNLASFIELPAHIYQPVYKAASILMWTFYAPSQVLIALSARRAKQIEENQLERKN